MTDNQTDTQTERQRKRYKTAKQQRLHCRLASYKRQQYSTREKNCTQAVYRAFSMSGRSATQHIIHADNAEVDSVVSATPCQPSGTVFCLVYTMSLTLIHSETAEECAFWWCLSITLVRSSWTLHKAEFYKRRIEFEPELAVCLLTYYLRDFQRWYCFHHHSFVCLQMG